MRIRLRTLVLAALLALALASAAGVLLVRSGFYNIAATEQHTRPVFALLDYAMRRSVAARAGADEPADLGAQVRVVAGAALYRRHCLQCHGAPGISPDPLAFGLTPAPANLLAAARTWRPAEIFWVVKHGIKMTGMPAWEYRLSDREMWDVVAFVRAMALMTPQDYAALEASLPRQVQAATPAAPPSVRGNADAGRRAAGQYLCATCHSIPGLVSANHHVGPPLAGIATRTYIAGIVPNTPENMVRWLQDPRAIDPLSAMPALGLSEQDARDIAAFMATLDDVSAR